MGESLASPQIQAQQQTRWDTAPGLRNLAMAATLLTLAAVAVPALLPAPPAAVTLASITPVTSTPAVSPPPAAHVRAVPRALHHPAPLASATQPATSGLPVGGLQVPSGFAVRVNRHNRHGPAGQADYPVTITLVTPPAHGTVTTADATAMLPTQRGVMRNSQVKEIYYQSVPGFTGRDSFTYTRTSADPNDPLNGSSYTMVLDVR